MLNFCYMANLKSNEIERLRQAIRIMKPGQNLYKMLVKELGALGRWKAKPRGDGGNIHKSDNKRGKREEKP